MNRNNQHHNPFLVGYEQIRFERFVKVTDEDGFPLSAEIDLHSSQRHLPDNLILESRCRHNQREVFVLIDGQDVSDEFRKKYPYEGSIRKSACKGIAVPRTELWQILESELCASDR